MGSDDQDDDANEAKSGSGGATGQSSGGPQQEPGSPSESSEQEIPIGMPVTPEEFRRRKKEAEKADEEANGAKADSE